jgi:DNA topoisomerase 2-associated protein PAT1
MSFFGLDTSLPKDRGHNLAAPGFSQAPDPFAGLTRPNYDEGEEEA